MKVAIKPASQRDSVRTTLYTSRVDRFEVESRYISVARLSQALHEGFEPTV